MQSRVVLSSRCGGRCHASCHRRLNCLDVRTALDQESSAWVSVWRDAVSCRVARRVEACAVRRARRVPLRPEWLVVPKGMSRSS